MSLWCKKETRYAELRCKSNFSFLRGASHAHELAERAARLDYHALAIADRHTLAGVVRMHQAAKEGGLKAIIGAEVVPADGPTIALYAMNRAGYGRLARLITDGRLRSPKGECRLNVDDVLTHAAGLIGIVCDAVGQRARRLQGTKARRGRVGLAHHGRAGARDDVSTVLYDYKGAFGDRLYLGAQMHAGVDDERSMERIYGLSRELHVPVVAVNDVHYHEPSRRSLQDVLTCIREHCTLANAGHRLFANGERHLKSPGEMAKLFYAHPNAVARTVEIADRCTFSLDELRYEYPEGLCPPDRSAIQYLADLTWRGARQRYPGGAPERVRKLIEHELVLIRELSYEPYFLTVWDLVRFARSRGILCQGRGSAANSAVCYCLGVTAVDPHRIDLLFERFVSHERNEPPDIDVDFEHERREEVFQYIYGKYGRDRAGIVAEVITYRPRSAVRDVGKTLGLSLDRVDLLAKKLEWWGKEPIPEEVLVEAGLDPHDRTIRCLKELVKQIVGFPRHLSQHVGGVVITRGPLCEMVPIGNAAMPDRTFIEWDKDDIDALGILKVDCLALGMLTAIRKCFELVRRHEGTRIDNTHPTSSPSCLRASVPPCLSLHTIPPEDAADYDMICRADTVGVFQIESRAQMSMLPRLKPRRFYDLVIEVAIVRPGPIQGGMVHPYLRRRSGLERVVYPNDAIKEVLHKTAGVPLFQEQAMRLAVVAGGFTPGEADQLRRAMGAWRRHGKIEECRHKLMAGMRRNGLPEPFAQQVFEQIRGFGEYGFPESHAASFALLVYVSAWLKRYHPAAFTAALLNSQPMGFYAPAQLVRDARQHGVEVGGVDVNASGYDCTLEEDTEARRHGGTKGEEEGTEARSSVGWAVPTMRTNDDPAQWGVGRPAVRLGFRLIKGMSQAKVEGIVRGRADGVYRSVADLAHRSKASRAVLARLAAAGAFNSMGLDRREAVWQVLALSEELPLFAGIELEEAKAQLPALSLEDEVIADYDHVGLSLTAHPMSLVRTGLDKLKAVTADKLKSLRHGQTVRVAGLVLVRQRPGTASGIVFITLEDETGIANLVIRPNVYEKYRVAARNAVALVARGRVERRDDVIHINVYRLEDLSDAIRLLRTRSRDFH